MSTVLNRLLNSRGLEPQLTETDEAAAVDDLEILSGLRVYPRSITAMDESILFLGKNVDDGGKWLACLSIGPGLAEEIPGESLKVEADGNNLSLRLCATSQASVANGLRKILPWLVPKTLGLAKSAGCGDRLGLATPGHVRAIRHSSMAPIFAQQSIRENARTGRTPQQVMDEAMWGIFQEGWREGFGADADHLKNTDDIDACSLAGFTFYTIDPGEYVDNEANTAPVETLRQKVAVLPWGELETTWDEVKSQLGNGPIGLGSIQLEINEEQLLRATAKYGRVVAHTVKMYRHLKKVMGDRAFELEMSVDETETVTTLAEHIFIAHELKRLGVKWVSLAPRYVGDFEKGVDYIGDLGAFEKSFAEHLAVAETFGPYKLSLHSGSDKFRIYPIAGRLAGNLVHLKTAGTSYLEALRTIGKTNAGLFREIVSFARERYPDDRATYHVSAQVEKMPDISTWTDDQLTDLLNDFHAREILHVTFGSVLHHPAFRDRFFSTLRENEETYAEMIETHFSKHFAGFEETNAVRGI
jgi:tagaturonate epimerase